MILGKPLKAVIISLRFFPQGVKLECLGRYIIRGIVSFLPFVTLSGEYRHKKLSFYLDLLDCGLRLSN